MRISTADSQGNIVSDTYTGALEDEKAFLISTFKQAASNKLLEETPSFKQINAALGVYDATKSNAIIAKVQETLNSVAAYEGAVNGCKNFNELKSL